LNPSNAGPSSRSQGFNGFNQNFPSGGGMRFGFSFKEADDLFRRAFGGRDPFEDFFGDDDDFFGGGFGRSKPQKASQNQRRDPFAGMGFGSSMMDDDDFFGGGGMRMNMMGGGMGGGFSSF